MGLQRTGQTHRDGWLFESCNCLIIQVNLYTTHLLNRIKQPPNWYDHFVKKIKIIELQNYRITELRSLQGGKSVGFRQQNELESIQGVERLVNVLIPPKSV
jgi:hypothetical protein